MRYVCPVCNYGALPEPPTDYLICPSCGTEFGYTDFNTSHEKLYERWLAHGMKWHSKVFAPPPDWNPLVQISSKGLKVGSDAASAPTQVVVNGPLVTDDPVTIVGIHVQIFGNLLDLQNVVQPVAA